MKCIGNEKGGLKNDAPIKCQVSISRRISWYKWMKYDVLQFVFKFLNFSQHFSKSSVGWLWCHVWVWSFNFILNEFEKLQWRFFSFNFTISWASPSIILLTSDETPLPSGKITMDEASWIASLLCIGGLIGNIFFGYITNRFGRKLPLIVIAIPTVVSDIWRSTSNSQENESKWSMILTDKLAADFICTKCVLLICVEIA